MASQIIGTVSGQSLTLEQELIVTGTNKYLTAEFKFSPDWDGLSIWAHFDRDNEHWKINLHDGKILREDKFAPLTGYWEVCLHGTATDGMRITTQPVDLRVRRTNVDPDLPLGEIPSDVAEQLDSRVTALEAGGGGGGTGGVSKEYVDRQDDEMLMDAMEYTDNQIKLVPTPDVDKAYVDKQDKATAAAVDGKLDKASIGEATPIDTQEVHLSPDGKLVTQPLSGSATDIGYEESTENTKELKPNVLCKFVNPLDTLTITLKPAVGFAIYDFIFTSGSGGCSLTLPESVKWDGGSAPILAESSKYEVSVLDNVAICSKGVRV